ncbi:MAG: hypothetical protein HY868_16595 [Chloroflexi bacterium]|nr:hypothetical protein [Chloroflexota bacterium]
MLSDLLFLLSKGIRIEIIPQPRINPRGMVYRVYFFRPQRHPFIGSFAIANAKKELAELFAEVRRVHQVLS